jgi:hypothetical protein
MDAQKDENSVTFTKKALGDLEAVRDYIEQRLSVAHGPAAAVGEPDVADQIRKLAALRDEGLLTPEEFESKKADLLGRL